MLLQFVYTHLFKCASSNSSLIDLPLVVRSLRECWYCPSFKTFIFLLDLIIHSSLGFSSLLNFLHLGQSQVKGMYLLIVGLSHRSYHSLARLNVSPFGSLFVQFSWYHFQLTLLKFAYFVLVAVEMLNLCRWCVNFIFSLRYHYLGFFIFIIWLLRCL